jgi:hypothetical protein
VAVHTTQFAIRDPRVALFELLLELARDEFDRLDAKRSLPLVRVGGICGSTKQATGEAGTLTSLGFHASLLNLGAMRDANDDQLIDHCRAVAEIIPVFGFYLHTAVGGRELSHAFWRRFLEIDKVVAIKVAAFNRYQTIDVVRAVAESGRDDVALYTGNDDNIVADLVTPFRFDVNGALVERRFVGGLLGHWAVWTKCAVELLDRCHAIARGDDVGDWMRTNIEVTDMNAVIFDAANGFSGCIPGVQEVLTRAGLLEHNICLDPNEVLSPGQAEQIDRICVAYPHLTDDDFVAVHRDSWLRS